MHDIEWSLTEESLDIHLEGMKGILRCSASCSPHPLRWCLPLDQAHDIMKHPEAYIDLHSSAPSREEELFLCHDYKGEDQTI